MPSKQVIQPPFLLNLEPDEEEVPQAITNDSGVFEPWDYMGSDMYTYKKLRDNLLNLKPEILQAIEDGDLKIPNVVSALIDHESRSNITSAESYFDFPNGKVAVYAKEAYGEEQHNQAYNFVSHLFFTNILFNIKEMFYLVDSSGTNPNDWQWSPVTSNTITYFKNTPDKYFLIKLDLSENTKTIIKELGFDISKSGFASHHNHALPHSQYFIMSTEDINLIEYYNLEPDTRANEPDVVYNDDFLNAIDNFDLSSNEDEATFSYTNSIVSPQDFYSYKIRKPNSDIVTEVDRGDPYVQR